MAWKLVVRAGYTLLAMRWGARHSATGLAVAASAVVAGCGSGARAGTQTAVWSTPVPVTSGGSLSKYPPDALSRRAVPGVGTKQRVDAAGARLEVTLRRVIDPLRGSGAALPPHTRAVGVVVQI